MDISVGDSYRVVSPFNQSGEVFEIDTVFTVRWSGSGSQVGCEFDEELSPAFHTCGGEVQSGFGFWIYRYLIQEHCLPDLNVSKPTWVL